MNSKKLICLATLSVFLHLTARSQTLLRDDLRGTRIDTSKWAVWAPRMGLSLRTTNWYS